MGSFPNDGMNWGGVGGLGATSRVSTSSHVLLSSVPLLYCDYLRVVMSSTMALCPSVNVERDSPGQLVLIHTQHKILLADFRIHSLDVLTWIRNVVPAKGQYWLWLIIDGVLPGWIKIQLETRRSDSVVPISASVNDRPMEPVNPDVKCYTCKANGWAKALTE